jgi:SAM-dependent methyltransferase
MKQEDLNKYFSTVWRSNLTQYKHSGWAIVDKIQSNELVLDVGCGYNEFKPRILNLVGIDPANDLADYKVNIEEFSMPNYFDVALCLGSINFGDKLTIMNQIACVINCLKPTARIYWRCNPGYADHGNDVCKDIEFYPWSVDDHIKLSELFGFKLLTCCWDNNRIYAEWSRSA